MSNKPIKISNYIGRKVNIENYISDVDKDIKNIINYLAVTPRFISQAAEPTIPSNEYCFWNDSDDSKYYLLVNFNGTQKKVELA